MLVDLLNRSMHKTPLQCLLLCFRCDIPQAPAGGSEQQPDTERCGRAEEFPLLELKGH